MQGTNNQEISLFAASIFFNPVARINVGSFLQTTDMQKLYVQFLLDCCQNSKFKKTFGKE